MSARSRVRVALAGTLLALATAVSVPAAASHAPETPVLASGASSTGWVSYKVFTTGPEILFDVATADNQAPYQTGVYVYREDRSLLGGITISSFGNETSAIVELTPPVGPPVREERVVSRTGTGGNTSESRIIPGGPDRAFYVLAWGAGTEIAWSHAVRGEPWNDPDTGGVRILSRDEGTRAFLYRSRDFRSVAHVEAHAVVGAGGRVTVAGQRVLEVEDTLVGLFTPLFPIGSVPPLALQANRMSVDTPAGPRDCFQSCSFSAFQGAGHAGPGTYAFHLTGAGASALGHLDDVM
ncbi:MAG: hypothetical protein M3245_02945, partial [Actinomycetota bacterium]|nr:hypothetical protein [Actinomycetota bacterium]